MGGWWGRNRGWGNGEGRAEMEWWEAGHAGKMGEKQPFFLFFSAKLMLHAAEIKQPPDHVTSLRNCLSGYKMPKKDAFYFLRH